MENLEKLISEFSKIEVYIKLGFIALTSFLAIAVILFTLGWVEKKFPELWFSKFLRSLKRLSFSFVFFYSLFELILMMSHVVPELLDKEAILKTRSLIFAVIAILATLKFKRYFLKNLDEKTAENDSVDSSLIFAADKILTIMICLFGFLMILDSFGVPINTLLAFGGIGGFAISWASKDVIANFFGGLMIFLHRPFVNGDWISSPNKQFDGVVEKIGWYRTQIRTFERRPAYIPNSQITDAIIQNPSRMYNRRIKEDIGLRYNDIAVVKNVIEEIRSMLKSHEGIAQDQTLMVHLLHYGAYSIDINIYCFTKTKNWKEFRDIQQEVLLLIAEIVKKNGADFAFPTKTVYTPDISSLS